MNFGLLSVAPTDLTTLNANLAVELWRRLLWAEARRLGISQSLISVPDCINVGDGGIDATTESSAHSDVSIIPIGLSGYQIKASDLAPQECKNELHEQEDIANPMKQEVKDLMEKDGTYVLILYHELTDAKIKKRKQALEAEFKSLGFPNPKIRIYTASMIAGFIENFPALVCKIKPHLSQLISHTDWANRPGIAKPRLYTEDEARKNLMESIRNQIRSAASSDNLIFRINGLPGIGKTRFVFEILKPDDLSKSCVYVEASDFLSSPLPNLLLTNQNLSAILVIDECDVHQHHRIVDRLGNCGSRLPIITMSYQAGKIPEPTKSYDLSPLPQSEIEKIIQTEYKSLPSNVCQRLAQFASGYPRIGVLLGESYQKTGGKRDDTLSIPDDILINRLVCGKSEISNAEADTIAVLKAISLFEKIGFAQEVEAEAKWLAKRENIKWETFTAVVQQQKNRGIIQGQHYIYVTPFMLKVHFIKQWWDEKGLRSDTLTEFVNSMPENFKNDLFQRFSDHIKYLTTTEKGRSFVKELLSENGPFKDGNLLKDKSGANFFLSLAEANPQASIENLKAIFDGWSFNDFKNFTTGRRYIIHALEKAVKWQDLFQDSARLLLLLAEAENEDYSNNASGIFCGLFSLNYGEFAPTETPPQLRLEILKEAIESKSDAKQELAVRACKKGLSNSGGAKVVGSEFVGLRPVANLWTPKTWGELHEAYELYFDFLLSSLNQLSDKNKKLAIETILHNCRNLIRMPNMTNKILKTLSSFKTNHNIDKKQLFDTISTIIQYDKEQIPKNILNELTSLKESIFDTSTYQSRLQRFVGLTLFEDVRDKGQSLNKEIKKLADESLKNPLLLEKELSNVISSSLQNAFVFGFNIGALDKNYDLLELILSQYSLHKAPAFHFLGGYLNASFERDVWEWESILDYLLSDKRFEKWVPELTALSGLTDMAGERLLYIAEHGSAEINFYNFSFGGTIVKLSPHIFNGWIHFLISSDDPNSVSTALQLFNFYYIHGKQSTLPFDITLKLLTHRTLFKPHDDYRFNQMTDYYWTEAAKVFIEQYPKESLKIARVLIENLGNKGSIIEGYEPQPLNVLTAIADDCPNEIWNIAKDLIAPPLDERAFYIQDWLEKIIDSVDHSNVISWINKDKKKRAPFVVTFSPKYLSTDSKKPSLLQVIISKYGTDKNVTSAAISHYLSGSWWGSGSDHYTSVKNEVVKAQSLEKNSAVKKWLRELIQVLDKQIKA